jgi:hypothetical protein
MPARGTCFRLAGITLGPRAGLATGAGAALASNMFLGQGPWTPWQMIGWGMVGLIAGWMPNVLRNRLALAAFGVACGFGFDWLMDIWEWSALGPGANASSFIALVAAGIWFDVAHAVGNAVIALVADKPHPHAGPLRGAGCAAASHHWRERDPNRRHRAAATLASSRRLTPEPGRAIS